MLNDIMNEATGIKSMDKIEVAYKKASKEMVEIIKTLQPINKRASKDIKLSWDKIENILYDVLPK